MIHIKKDSTPPNILIKNKDNWTKELEDNIKQYGEYKKIPSNIKNSILKYYKHQDIKKKLFASSYQKCAFCESKPAESGNIEVEHFKPKSLYPELAFDWENLLPICRRCNNSKSDHDTGKEPIVDPSHDDPEKIFTYYFLNIIPLDDKNEIAHRTIEICDLNSERLFEIRANLLKALSSYESQVKAWIKEIETADTEIKKRNKINRLRDSIEILEKLTDPKETYSGFSKYYISQSKEYQKAKKIINNS